MGMGGLGGGLEHLGDILHADVKIELIKSWRHKDGVTQAFLDVPLSPSDFGSNGKSRLT